MLRIAAVVVVLAGCDRFLQLQEVPQPPPPDAAPLPSSWASVAAGYNHTCAIREDQTLWCWGRNDKGQLGTPPTSFNESDHPVELETDTWLAVSANEHHACAIRTNHTLACWGNNGDGALGTGGYETVDGFWPIAGTSWMTVSTGATFGCGIDMAGQMQCWGNNSRGELGNISTVPPSGPIPVGGGPWASVAAGAQHACAIDTTGVAFCWGSNGYGEVGKGANSGVPEPVTRVVGTDTFTKLASGNEFTCGLTTGGHLRCWGQNDVGQLGNGNRNTVTMPEPVAGDSGGWVDIDAGSYHACALDQQGALWCWGYNGHGELATATPGFDYSTVPVMVSGGASAWTALGLGDQHTCAIAASDHLMWCAGLGAGGQTASLGSHTTPLQLAGTWTKMGAGTRSTCAIDAAMHMSCWGGNTSGGVGDGTTTPRQIPTAVSGNQMWSGAAVGDHVCGLDYTNVLYCWGENGAEELGDGTTTDRYTPTKTTLNNAQFAHVSSANDSTCVVQGTTPICWGESGFGQCGSTMNPQPPGSITATVTQIAVGDDMTCALPTAGGVACWGYSDALGDGSSTSRSTPGPVSTITGTVDQLVAGYHHACARAGMRLWCWGDGLRGQIGDQGNGIARTPFEHTGRMWTDVGAGGDHTCAIEMPGRLYCWGANDFGQLGDGSTLDRSLPTAIGTDTDWAQLILGGDHSCAFKTDGSLWCWGSNMYGQIGDGTAWRNELQIVQ